jgi:hypothetical protein
MVSQGEIVEVSFRLPDGTFKPHPVIVLSNVNIHIYENCFIGVMLSTSTIDDEFSFWLTNEMLSKKPKNQGQARCHLISLFLFSEIQGTHGRVKNQYFPDIISKINKSVFHV